MGAFRQKSGMHPFFCQNPMKLFPKEKINILKEKIYSS